MKHILLITLLLLIGANCLMAQMTTPRVYVQKLLLDNGEIPAVTSTDKLSAKEYTVRAYIMENPKDVMSTETHPFNSVTLKNVGDDVKFPKTVILSVQLGNFKSQWEAGQTLMIEVKHKKTKKKASWSIVIPEGTNLMKHLEDPQVIPPYSKNPKK
jgi:hypothetical protein